MNYQVMGQYYDPLAEISVTDPTAIQLREIEDQTRQLQAELAATSSDDTARLARIEVAYGALAVETERLAKSGSDPVVRAESKSLLDKMQARFPDLFKSKGVTVTGAGAKKDMTGPLIAGGAAVLALGVVLIAMR